MSKYLNILIYNHFPGEKFSVEYTADGVLAEAWYIENDRILKSYEMGISLTTYKDSYLLDRFSNTKLSTYGCCNGKKYYQLFMDGNTCSYEQIAMYLKQNLLSKYITKHKEFLLLSSPLMFGEGNIKEDSDSVIFHQESIYVGMPLLEFSFELLKIERKSKDSWYLIDINGKEVTDKDILKYTYEVTTISGNIEVYFQFAGIESFVSYQNEKVANAFGLSHEPVHLFDANKSTLDSITQFIEVEFLNFNVSTLSELKAKLSCYGIVDMPIELYNNNSIENAYEVKDVMILRKKDRLPYNYNWEVKKGIRSPLKFSEYLEACK